MMLSPKNTAAFVLLAISVALTYLVGCQSRTNPSKTGDGGHGDRRSLHQVEHVQENDLRLAARLYRLLEQRDKELASILRRVETLENEIEILRRGQEPERRAAAGSLTAAVGSAATSTERPVSDPATPALSLQTAIKADEDEIQAALERVLIKKSGLLLPPWTSEFEPGLTYVESSSDKITIDGVLVEPVFVVGDIVSKEVRRDIAIASAAYRLGLPRDFQTDILVPFRYQYERTVTAETTEVKRRALGLGDVEVGLSHQFFREYGGMPDLLGHVRWKTKTGTDPYTRTDPSGRLALGSGFNSFQFLLTSVKVQDPVAFFGGLSYTFNLSERKPQGRIAPGDVWGINAGMAIALNIENSLNFGWEQRFADDTTLDHAPLPGSSLRVGVFRVGVTHSLTRDVAMDVAVGIGLTRDAPDVQASVSFPIRLPAFAFGSPPPDLSGNK